MKRVLSIITLLFFTAAIYGVLGTDSALAAGQKVKVRMALTQRNRILVLNTDGTLWERSYPKGDPKAAAEPSLQQIKGVSGVRSVAAGADFTVILKNDRSVWAWGSNNWGQLGNGTYVKSSKPVKIKKLAAIRQIAACGYHGIALKEDGTVWAWGDAGYGTKAVNGIFSSPVQVKELSSVKSVTTGESYFAVLKKDGTVWTWGYGSSGADSRIPRKVPNIKDIVDLSSSGQHSLALKKDGSVYVWGSDSYIQYRNGGNVSCTTGGNVEKPYQVQGLNHVSRVFAGEAGAFIIKSDGSVWAWGSNEYGQLGDGSIANSGLPARVKAVSGVSQIAADYVHTLFVMCNGELWFCGYKNGTGEPYPVGYATAVKGLPDVKAVAASDRRSLAVAKDGTVWAWGLGIHGGSWSCAPQKVKGLSAIKDIEMCNTFATALSEDGTVWAWGSNWQGELGDSTLASQENPVKVPVLEDIEALSSNSNLYTLALKKDGTVWGFGRDQLDRLGSANHENVSAPKRIEGLSGIKELDAGSDVALALADDGTLYAWRYNGLMMNAGGAYPAEKPQKVEGISDILHIKNGAVLKKDGSVWRVGNSRTPVRIAGLDKIKAIYCADDYGIYAVQEDETLYYAALNPSAAVKKPELKLNGNEISFIGLRLALKTDGSVMTWGDNDYGQAGNGDCGFVPVPARMN